MLVLTSISLCMILLVALLSTSQTELTSTAASARGASARLHADTAVSLVIGQIQSATHQDTETSGIETWTSQPGMVRQYKENGILLKGNKLYSDRKMVATSDDEIINDTPPEDWDLQTDRYVDMNEPVARRDENQPDNPPRWFFPIIDPRAYATDPSKSVEGFSYSKYVNGISGTVLQGVKTPGEEGEDAQRLPMPVEWLYLLKDGTIGYLNDDKTFVGPRGVTANQENPIVSRIAFWTDDESCKININTAAEGTYWDTPRLYHDRDGDWARYQPMTYEYQRYPGHPATVSMSTVLFPNENMNPSPSDSAQFDKALAFKETIYYLIPKILPGGSKAGSVLVPAGRAFSPTDFKEVQKALNERLFASVDEFLLRPKIGADGERQEIDLQTSGAWSDLSRPEVVERLRPFLTPRSRSPEMNP
ncbi:MAG: Verru_Chthon cassette protein A, partial [Prosthecobacter sp.]|nr:Verru_Chthon cassette protein A [Prosthecobacter sp.]